MTVFARLSDGRGGESIARQEMIVQQFERERARMQSELAELSKQRVAMAAAQQQPKHY